MTKSTKCVTTLLLVLYKIATVRNGDDWNEDVCKRKIVGLCISKTKNVLVQCVARVRGVVTAKTSGILVCLSSVSCFFGLSLLVEGDTYCGRAPVITRDLGLCVVTVEDGGKRHSPLT